MTPTSRPPTSPARPGYRGPPGSAARQPRAPGQVVLERESVAMAAEALGAPARCQRSDRRLIESMVFGVGRICDRPVHAAIFTGESAAAGPRARAIRMDALRRIGQTAIQPLLGPAIDSGAAPRPPRSLDLVDWILRVLLSYAAIPGPAELQPGATKSTGNCEPGSCPPSHTCWARPQATGAHTPHLTGTFLRARAAPSIHCVALLSLDRAIQRHQRHTVGCLPSVRPAVLSVLPETLRPVSVDDPGGAQLDRRAARLLERQRGVLSRAAST